MTPRVEQEIDLIRKFFSDMKYHEAGWVLLPKLKIPTGIWEKDAEEVCFQIPPGYPGQPPYGFYVKNGLHLKGSNQNPTNYTETSEPPFGGVWGKFSWQVDGTWQQTADIHSGSNLLSFIRSFNDRLKEGN